MKGAGVGERFAARGGLLTSFERSLSMRPVFALFLPLALLVGCASNSGGGGGKCNEVCNAQAAGCAETTADYAQTCSTLCGAIAPSCQALYDAYATCELAVGYQCSATMTVNGKPAPVAKDSTTCKTELEAYAACSRAGATRCSGADAEGFCPAVTCECPNGTTTSVSGSKATGSGSCACLDATTCKTSFACR